MGGLQDNEAVWEGKMILQRDIKTYVGKIIKEIRADSLSGANLVMCDEVVVDFTDGTTIVLRTDWRGNDCYISEYTK